MTRDESPQQRGFSRCAADSTVPPGSIFDAPRDAEDNAALTAAIAGAGATSAWLNVSDAVAERYWLEGEPYTAWRALEPSHTSGGNNEDCAAIESGVRGSAGMLWNDRRCDETLRVVCRMGDGQWRIVGPPVRHQQGGTLCAASGGRFVAPDSDGENIALSSVAAAAGGGAIWINLSDAAYEDSWRPVGRESDERM